MSLARQLKYDYTRERPAEWFGNGTATNATATASAPAASANVQQYLTSLHVSFNAAGNGIVQILDGATVIFQKSAVNPGFDIVFKNPLKATLGNQITATIAA